MYYKILEELKKTESYISGEELGEKLGVSRAAIWKGIQKLKEQGYEIEAVSNKGYHIVRNQDLYNGIEIEEVCNTTKIAKEVYFYEQTDSTNNCIRKLAKEGKKEGVVAVAEIQTAGKGRRGKGWQSPKGTGIWMSMLLTPNITPPEAPVLTLLAGLAVCRAVRQQTGLTAMIKWPNDILISNKKICGILTELYAEMDSVHFVITGIGINVNTEVFPEELQKTATSLKIEKGETISRKNMIKAVIEEFEKIYLQYEKECSFLPFREEYKKYCINVGKELQVLSKQPFIAKGIDITEQGELLVQKQTGEKVVVFSGEVSIRNI
ncbi:MAG: biotin--[acetyl-CoA-carboxylase] ligase [Firmicutes bacterium]|jgi:BirA family biotin operon repressor/biotin-[acetyl-CoA-carboxylase] ligase|nr:biotin--[acetyl-CoA-carboxylase] ligase [Bacillota bacterium]